MIKFRFGGIVVLAMALTISCENELQEPVKIEEELLMDQAKVWFESTQGFKSYGRGRNAITPRWDRAISFKHTVEMPYTIDGKLSMPASIGGLKNQGRNRLLINKNKNSFSAHIISYSPSTNFNGDIKIVNAKNFKALKFDGTVSIEDLKLGILKVLNIERGIVTKELWYRKSSNLNGRVAECWEQCTIWFQWSGGEWSYLDTQCTYWCDAVEPVDPWAGDDPYSCSVNATWPWCGDGGGGNTGTSPSNFACIVNQIQNPCLSGVANNVANPSLQNTFNNLIQEIFNESDQVNWILKDQSNIAGNANTPPAVCDGNNYLNITTWLDPVDLANKPEEFIATTILHEGLHAVLHYYGGNTNPTAQHIEMLSNYLNQISYAVNQAYPSMPIGDVKGLLLMEIFPLNILARAAILEKTGYTEPEVLAIFQNYSSGSMGTPCN